MNHKVIGGKSYRVAYVKWGVFLIVVVSIPPYAEFGPNDHWEDAPHFTM